LFLAAQQTIWGKGEYQVSSREIQHRKDKHMEAILVINPVKQGPK